MGIPRGEEHEKRRFKKWHAWKFERQGKWCHYWEECSYQEKLVSEEVYGIQCWMTTVLGKQKKQIPFKLSCEQNFLGYDVIVFPFCVLENFRP